MNKTIYRALQAYFFLTITFLLSGCPKNIPRWEKNIYHGNPEKKGLERTQSQEFIACDDPRFKKMVAVFIDDWDCSVETYILNASGWNKQSACGLQPTNTNP